jgi:hypothetical protein
MIVFRLLRREMESPPPGTCRWRQFERAVFAVKERATRSRLRKRLMPVD